MSTLDVIDIDGFRSDLIGWFEEEQRNLPWRADRDPYKVWVSEIMLQQTKVDTVIPYFNRFMEWFPTLTDFAEAEEEKILKAWEGLGYYSRVRNLQSAVREVKEQYGGIVPDSPKEILSLKGVGPYTAGAILSIAYGLPEPAVDGNVMRVLSRVLLIKDDIAKPKTRLIFEEAVRKLISHDNPSAFNQGMMELGALICTPGNPSCLLCPVREHCEAFKQGVQNELPVKIKVKKVKKLRLLSCVILNEEGRILVVKRPSKGLLAGLWEFPTFISEGEEAIKTEAYEEWFASHFGAEVELEPEKLGEVRHLFSHLVWDIDAYAAVIKDVITDEVLEANRMKWVTEKDMEDMAFPVPHQKVFQSFIEQF